MKAHRTHLLPFLTGLALMALLAFKSRSYEAGFATAEVSQIEGFYIFTDSKPVMPYDSLGFVELGFVSGTQYESIRANLIKRARTKQPQGDGLILDLQKKGLDRCLVIKFKH